ncbi:MAG: FGGY-family carbohydrate kinase [Spirochaetaceae bacterium]|nr:FGGY-family carbohydrate kinase [Spirochaetaceae bacterium]
MILAADLGTGSLKAGLLAPDGTLTARVRIPYPHPSGLGREDFDSFQWEDAFREALKRLPPARLSAVALSGNGPTLVPCDAAGIPLAPADLWLQNRSIRHEGTDSYYLPKAAWLKAHDHGTWKNTRILLSCPEWLQFRLTGRPVMVLPNESFRRYIWDDRQLSAYDLDAGLFPEVVPMGSIVGGVTGNASVRFGLPVGLPLVAVGSDFMAALLGSGAIEPGMVCDRAGTSEGINYCASHPSGDKRLRDLPHVVEGLWNAAVILSSTGAVFEWYRRLTGQVNRSYEETLSAVADTTPGQRAPLFFPGPRGDVLWEFGGGSFHLLEPGHGPAEMGRAVMEAIGFAVRRGVELLEAAGLPVVDMRVTGGQARGRVWNQMKADIVGKQLLIPDIEDAELAGAAACASAALGRSENILEASRNYVRIREVVDPDAEVGAAYDEAYARYREAVGSLLHR